MSECDREEVQDVNILELKIRIVGIIERQTQDRLKSCCKR